MEKFEYFYFKFQFNILMELLRDMLCQIDRQRRLKMVSEVPDSNALELR